MDLASILVLILVISFIASLVSLWFEIKKPSELKHAREALSKEKILFRQD